MVSALKPCFTSFLFIIIQERREIYKYIVLVYDKYYYIFLIYSIYKKNIYVPDNTKRIKTKVKVISHEKNKTEGRER